MRRSTRSKRRARISNAALRAADHDPHELERIEERLFALRAAGRKYKSPVDELAALAAQHAADLALIDAGAERLAALEAAAREAERAYDEAAAALSAARKKAAAKLDKAVNGELKPLKLERAQFSTRSRPMPRRRPERHRPRRVLGADQSGHAAGAADEGRVGRRACALPAGAEGGAGRSRLGADAGVRRDRHRRRRRGRGRHRRCGSRGLPSSVQVVAVTHAPQVAARAERHYLSPRMRSTSGKRVATRVSELAADRRREEIARMLAGAEITDEARAAAERLIRAAG